MECVGNDDSNGLFVLFLQQPQNSSRVHGPEQSGLVEGVISRAFKGGHAAHLSVRHVYPDFRLDEIRGCTDAVGTNFNRAATFVDGEWLSLNEVFYGNRPPLPLLPFFHSAYHRVLHQRKTEPRAQLCFFLYFGYDHRRNCSKLLDEETRRAVYSHDIT